MQSETLTPTNPAANGASLISHLSEVSIYDSIWNVEVQSQSSWQFIIILDSSWGFDPFSFSSIKVTVNSPTTTSGSIIFGLTADNQEYLSISIPMNEINTNHIYPNCDTNSKPTQTYAVGDIASIPDFDRDCDISGGSCSDWKDMLPLNTESNKYPISFILENSPASNTMSISSDTSKGYVQSCGFVMFPINRGLKIYIAANDQGQTLKISSFVIESFIDSLPPTSAPTTSKPTVSPTNDPSFAPSNAPTNLPTNAPSNNPTQTPSIAPTISPTNTPTNNPSFSPSNAPSIVPSITPSNTPTAPPTMAPTISPVISPSNAPSNAPIISPTTAPSTIPSSAPTQVPTTRDPTSDPTKNPTYDPTYDPTNDPTMIPTVNPTKEPTMDPTHGPTVVPTLKPSTNPTMFVAESSVSHSFLDEYGVVLIICASCAVCVALLNVVCWYHKKGNGKLTEEGPMLNAIHDEGPMIEVVEGKPANCYTVTINYIGRVLHYHLPADTGAVDHWSDNTYNSLIRQVSNNFNLHRNFILCEEVDGVKINIDDIDDIIAAFESNGGRRQINLFVQVDANIKKAYYSAAPIKEPRALYSYNLDAPTSESETSVDILKSTPK